MRGLPLVLREGRCGGVTEDEGAELLRTLARAMIELGEVGRTGVISLPYPPLVQRTLDRIVSVCLDRNERPPGSVPELVAWCAQRTRDCWPFLVPANLIRSDSVLVDPIVHTPTRTCLELACDGSESSPEQQSRDMLRRLDEASGPTGRVSGSRRFLIDHPIVINGDTVRTPKQMAIWRRVRHLYERVPSTHVVERRVLTCPTCGLLARTDAWSLMRGQLTWCEAELCPRGLAPVRHRADTVMLLCEPLRMFLALPGRTERRVCDALAAVGVDIALVDAVEGTYELGAPVRGKRILHALDRVEPALLANTATRWPGSLVVVPQRHIDSNVGFRAAFAAALPPAANVSLISDDELIAHAGGSGKELGRA